MVPASAQISQLLTDLTALRAKRTTALNIHHAGWNRRYHYDRILDKQEDRFLLFRSAKLESKLAAVVDRATESRDKWHDIYMGHLENADTLGRWAMNLAAKAQKAGELPDETLEALHTAGLFPYRLPDSAETRREWLALSADIAEQSKPVDDLREERHALLDRAA